MLPNEIRNSIDLRKIGGQAAGSPLMNQITSKVAHGNVVWTVAGANLGSTGINALKYRLPYVGNQATIEEIYVQLGTAPAASNLQVTLYKNGANLLTGTTYIQIAIGATTATRVSGFAASGAIVKDDYFQFYVVQGDATAADMVLHLRYFWYLGVG